MEICNLKYYLLYLFIFESPRIQIFYLNYSKFLIDPVNTIQRMLGGQSEYISKGRILI